MKKRLFLVLAALALVACGGGGGSGDSDITGNWNGTATGTINGVSQSTVVTVKMTLAQNGSNVNGTFSSTSGNTGQVVGTMSGSNFTGDLLPSNPNNCPAKMVLFYSNNTLQGSTATYNCTASVSGNATFTR